MRTVKGQILIDPFKDGSTGACISVLAIAAELHPKHGLSGARGRARLVAQIRGRLRSRQDLAPARVVAWTGRLTV